MFRRQFDAQAPEPVTRKDFPWTNSQHSAGDLRTGVQKLKDATPGGLFLGSGKLATELDRLDLIDEYNIGRSRASSTSRAGSARPGAVSGAVAVKASAAGRDCSLSALQKRLGAASLFEHKLKTGQIKSAKSREKWEFGELYVDAIRRADIKAGKRRWA